MVGFAIRSSEGVSVIFITTYKIKQQSKDEAKKLMGVFAEKGVPSTVKAHYVAADGSQGVVVAEADDLEEAYRNILNYSEWIEYDTKPYLTIEQALPTSRTTSVELNQQSSRPQPRLRLSLRAIREST